ncbi:MAG: hypothetical protein KGJ62_12720 [Armatimonadetes bacterium]|nr:hypothetical protein [Armatimonadota bacterium]
MNAKPFAHLRPLAIIITFFLGATASAKADPVYHWRILAGVHSVAIVPPQFFLGEPAKRHDRSRHPEHPGKAPAVTEEQKQAVYAELEARLGRELPAAVRQYGRFRVARFSEVKRALGRLKLQPSQLFAEQPSHKSAWPAANLANLQKLAAALQVDAVVVCALRPPQSVGEHIDITRQGWDPDPFDIGLLRVPLHVVSPRAHALMITRGGDLA